MSGSDARRKKTRRFERIVRDAAEQLLEDERMRSDLTDGESKIVLDWARMWLETQIGAARDEASARQIAQSELAHVREVGSALNALARSGNLQLADAVAAVSASLGANDMFTREQILELATGLASAAWRIRAQPQTNSWRA